MPSQWLTCTGAGHAVKQLTCRGRTHLLKSVYVNGGDGARPQWAEQCASGARSQWVEQCASGAKSQWAEQCASGVTPASAHWSRTMVRIQLPIMEVTSTPPRCKDSAWRSLHLDSLVSQTKHDQAKSTRLHYYTLLWATGKAFTMIQTSGAPNPDRHNMVVLELFGR